MRLGWLLSPKHALFRDHDGRLRESPDPPRARMMFDRRLRQMRRVQTVRTVFFVATYFSVVVAGASFFTSRLDALAPVADLLKILAQVASSFTVVFVAGIFVATRILSHLEVDLYFFSAESRMESAATGRG